MSINKSVAKSAGIIGIATLCSRILGFIRDVVIARLFGVYVYAQAFVVAFRIPNLFRDLVGEGAANAAFVPVLSEYAAKRSKEEFWELVNVVLNLLLIIVSTIVLLGVIFAPVIVRLIAPGFVDDPQKMAATVTLTRLVFPYLLLISLAAYSMAILNTLKHFSIPAFAPCLLNISIIICAMMFGEGIKGLALGVLIGGFLQLAAQIPLVYKKGFRLNLRGRFKHPGATLIGKLMVPRLLSSSIYQFNNFVDSIFGSMSVLVGEGGVAVLYFSYRLIQFPVGVFTNAISQAILPTFSTQALEQDHAQLKKTLLFGLRATFFVMVPASVAFMVLAHPIIEALFGGGRFDAYSAQATARTLFFYSIGLSAYGATRVMQTCFFAIKDTVTPTKIAGMALGMNILFTIIFIYPLKICGIALSSSLSGIISFSVLFVILRRRLSPLSVRPLVLFFVKVLAASLLMGIVCYYAAMVPYVPWGVPWAKLINLGVVVIAGIVSYGLFCVVLKVNELQELFRWIRTYGRKQRVSL